MDITANHNFTLCRAWQAMKKEVFQGSSPDSGDGVKPAREPKWLERRLSPVLWLLHSEERRSADTKQLESHMDTTKTTHSLDAQDRLLGPSSPDHDSDIAATVNESPVLEINLLHEEESRENTSKINDTSAGEAQKANPLGSLLLNCPSDDAMASADNGTMNQKNVSVPSTGANIPERTSSQISLGTQGSPTRSENRSLPDVSTGESSLDSPGRSSPEAPVCLNKECEKSLSAIKMGNRRQVLDLEDDLESERLENEQLEALYKAEIEKLRNSHAEAINEQRTIYEHQLETKDRMIREAQEIAEDNHYQLETLEAGHKSLSYRFRNLETQLKNLSHECELYHSKVCAGKSCRQQVFELMSEVNSVKEYLVLAMEKCHGKDEELEIAYQHSQVQQESLARSKYKRKIAEKTLQQVDAMVQADNVKATFSELLQQDVLEIANLTIEKQAAAGEIASLHNAIQNLCEGATRMCSDYEINIGDANRQNIDLQHEVMNLRHEKQAWQAEIGRLLGDCNDLQGQKMEWKIKERGLNNSISSLRSEAETLRSQKSHFHVESAKSEAMNMVLQSQVATLESQIHELNSRWDYRSYQAKVSEEKTSSKGAERSTTSMLTSCMGVPSAQPAKVAISDLDRQALFCGKTSELRTTSSHPFETTSPTWPRPELGSMAIKDRANEYNGQTVKSSFTCCEDLATDKTRGNIGTIEKHTTGDIFGATAKTSQTRSFSPPSSSTFQFEAPVAEVSHERKVKEVVITSKGDENMGEQHATTRVEKEIEEERSTELDIDGKDGKAWKRAKRAAAKKIAREQKQQKKAGML